MVSTVGLNPRLVPYDYNAFLKSFFSQRQIDLLDLGLNPRLVPYDYNA